MANLFEFKKDVITYFQQSAVMAEKMGFKSSAEVIRETTKGFSEKELMVVTVGEMKRGKSSLMNALLEEMIFPVNTSVATNVVTIARFGKKEKVEAIIEEMKDGVLTPIVKTITRAEIPDYVSEQGNPSNFRNVKVLNIEVPNPVLQEGIVFVDTPGVGSLNINHAETTYGFLPNADLLLFVCDSSAGLTETETNFLKRGYRYCKNILFPLTKKDLNPQYKEIMQDNQHKISEALGISEEEVKVIPISSSAKLRYQETGSKAMLASSNFAEFENAIWSTIAAKRGEIMFVPFVERVRQELYKMADSIAAQYQLLESDKEKLSVLAEELNKEIESYNVLKKSDASWKKELTQFFSLMQNSNSTKLSQIKLDVRTYLDEQLVALGPKICEPIQYNQVYNEINSIISQGLLDRKEAMIEETLEEVNKINGFLGLNVDSCRNALDNMEFEPKDKMEVTFPKRKKSDKLMAGGRKIGMGAMGGSKIGLLAGGVAGVGLAVLLGPAALAASAGVSVATAVIGSAVGASGLGAGVGSVLGGAKGCIDAVKTSHDVDVPIVQKAFVKHIESSMILIQKVIADGFITLRNEVISELESELSEKEQELKDNIEQIKGNISSAKPDKEKLAELKNRSETVKKYLTNMERIDKSIANLAKYKSAEVDMYNQAESAQLGKKPEAAETDEKKGYNFL